MPRFYRAKPTRDPTLNPEEMYDRLAEVAAELEALERMLQNLVKGDNREMTSAKYVGDTLKWIKRQYFSRDVEDALDEFLPRSRFYSRFMRGVDSAIRESGRLDAHDSPEDHESLLEAVSGALNAFRHYGGEFGMQVLNLTPSSVWAKPPQGTTLRM